jgi:hypothetical protein
VGKTTLATEFVHRWGQFFAGGVFWLSFADPANIPVEIAQCGGAGHMQLFTDAAGLSLPDQVAAVQRAWAEEMPRLLVFDNVDTDDAETLVQQWRPTTGGCRVLITSRRGLWDAGLGIAALPLGTLPRAESRALLRQFRANLPDTDADAIAAELGDLPLALHLAGSFLKKYARTSQGDPAAFLARLRDPALLEHPALTGRATGTAWSYQERSVARAFALSYERLDPADEADALALALLARAAHFALSRVDIFHEQRGTVKHFACGPASCYDMENHHPYHTGGNHDPHTRSMALAANSVNPSAVPQPSPGGHARPLEPGYRPDAERRIDHRDGMCRPDPRPGRTHRPRTPAVLVPRSDACPQTETAGYPAISAARHVGADLLRPAAALGRRLVASRPQTASAGT